jgi:serine/threonine-protein kinase RsbW
MKQTQILARTTREDFIGRDAELRAITQQGSAAKSRGILVFAAPGAGASELLRQAYDQLFLQRRFSIPLHFALKRGEGPPAETARRFFKTLLQQFIAYRRVDPSLCEAPLTLHDLAELALPADYELIAGLIEAFERTPTSHRELIDFCFSLPHRLSVEGRTAYSLIDCIDVQPFGEELLVARELIQAVTRVNGPFAIAGLRRHVGELLHDAGHISRDMANAIHIDPLGEEDASRLIDILTRRYGIATNQPTRDLIVQQLNGSPFYISEFSRAGRETGTQLTSFLNCQRLYVDELMGGSIKRHFDRVISSVADSPQTKRTLIRVLHESAMSETRKSSLWAWKKRLGLAANEFERLIEALHVYELVNSTAAFIEVNSDSSAWIDYLRAQYQLNVAGEPRAKVVATTLLETLKRAPQTMARKYRRETAIGLADLLPQFDCQSIPASLLHYGRFAAAYKGDDVETIDAGLDAESDLIRLPQIVHSSACSAYLSTVACDPNRCVVAHGFEAAEYTEENEIVWLAAEIDSKLEASRELTEEWCDRLASLAAENGFDRFRIWLIAREGFSAEASELLKQRDAFSSSAQQFHLLSARIESQPAKVSAAKADEYEMVIPMGEDSELVAARTIEEIARRVSFRPEAINQIKTALVEACINAAEHSLSPDRRIYQRFVVEDDRLVVTVASRGVVPGQLSRQNGQEASTTDEKEGAKSRRGWGLKLIKTLMDEVEFERVDDGTQLKMTKYIR